MSGLFAFDLDGTLVENHLIEGASGRLEPGPGSYLLPRMLPRRVEHLRGLASLGARFALVTNQGGVAFGHHTEEEANSRIGMALASLEWFFLRPMTVHVCFHHPRATVEGYSDPDECERRRKPAGGMIVEARLAHRASREETIYVGDLPTDREAAEDAGVGYLHPDEFFGKAT